ncbi:hypothetical protein OUZ56_017062 [Daphnia magna]|uniref:Uncharacterized protein n=1 Tax=Daphnia magna TaxID=35525 RepID=A0ABR0AS41_9CRUS|nr:hypothetical protein OUZ56_017062 [Daphnia magna]
MIREQDPGRCPNSLFYPSKQMSPRLYNQLYYLNASHSKQANNVSIVYPIQHTCNLIYSDDHGF